MGLNRPITIGRIDYTNVWPIFHYAEDLLPADRFVIDRRVPSALNAAMQRGEIDITSMSSYAYAQYADHFLLLPDLSVSAKGRVNSILLITKEPMEKVLGGTIAMTSTSATSINLLKILMSMYYQASPAFITMEPSLDQMLGSADAALLIGDTAITASWRSEGFTVIDLGELWRNWTGCGMTFALFAVRKEVAAADPQAVSQVLQALTASKSRSLKDTGPLVHKAMAQLGGTEAYWRQYFQGLTYNFGTEEQRGLSLYFEYARSLGLLDQDVRMEFFVDHTALQVNE
ncbi:menaquinone biosynthetic enzyme MqnA/MqnD family protein [Paenibacillus nasutitermitis]|uniref:Chorismate dehydratase n=1 Tax=Paenibacillus nasutitermitis TaxID=1652958 RepID=A0A917DUY8_9BACL|nr:menaquinone biosynthesis protein [Paenibacillus nasutitermitis]GGD69209.1 chorismate dehydratase [Paenibacillus nasutitermitis]